MLDFSPTRMLFVIPAIIIALSFHEYAHARVAYHYGDPTAKEEGRLTLNPLRHLDVVGTLLLIFAGFGWAKPVPVNPWYLGPDRKKKLMHVSIAGPLMNVLEALVGALIISLIYHFVPYSPAANYFYNFFYYFVYINITLAIFNLLPVPPLDGSKILGGLLPNEQQHIIYELERYGMAILLLLSFTGILGKIIGPIIWFFYDNLLKIVGM
ncbi:MAG: site-2 protease family protein [Firmicutes bacterium]|nr:site-2 protease family protein [Bacillota bacterium]MBQ3112669.1 site-2 protease family protein [Bacillota bacterium]